MNSIQNIELAILKEVDDICQRYGIGYQVIGGSLLGCVRHKGFIPWDDDIDIGMLRDDYERFLQIAELELKLPYRLQTYSNTESHHYYFTHVVDERFSVRRLGSMDQRVEKVWVDVYPLDGMPNNLIHERIHYIHLTFLNFMYHVGYFEKVNIARPDRALYQKIIISAIKPFANLVHFNGSLWREKLDKTLKKYSVNGSHYLFNFIGPKGRREIFESEIFLNTTEYSFEDMKVMGSSNPDRYLTQIYGNWKEPPKESEKKCHPMELLF